MERKNTILKTTDNQSRILPGRYDEGEKQAKGLFVVGNDGGLHTRPAIEVVKCATSFKSDIRLTYHDQEANAKSILGILMLAAQKGAKVDVIANGEDAEEAIVALIELAKNRFNVPL